MLLPPWIVETLRRVPIRIVQDILRADGVMTEYVKKIYDEVDADKDNERSDMMVRALSPIVQSPAIDCEYGHTVQVQVVPRPRHWRDCAAAAHHQRDRRVHDGW